MTTSPIGPLNLGRAPEVSLKLGYALWTQVEEGSSFTAAPGANLTQISMFPEPERTAIGAPLLSITGQGSRMLRSSFAEARPIRAPYQTFAGMGAFCAPRPLFCTTCPERPWDPSWVMLPRIVSNPGPLRVFRPGATRLTEAAILAVDTRGIDSIVASDALHWTASTAGIGAAVASIRSLAYSNAAAPMLAWVEVSSQAARWAILEAQATLPHQVQYAAAIEGSFPTGVSSTARLVGDGAGETIALFDRTNRVLAAFDPTALVWIQRQGLPEDLFARVGMTLGMVGSELFAIGGKFGGTTRSDGWIINVLTGRVRPWNFGLPARSGARLFPTSDGRALLFVGGIDMPGASHDDVWRIPLQGAGALMATRILSDSSAAASFDPSTVLFGSSTDLRLTAVGQLPNGAFADNVRTAAGWEAAECPPRDLTAPALFATNELRVNDGARVLLGSAFAQVASTGSLETNLGVAAEVGSVLSAPRVFLRDRAVVHGDLVTNANVMRQTATLVTGSTVEYSGYGASALSCALSAFPATNGGDVGLEPDQTRTLQPGAYRNVSIKTRAVLKLSAGTYYFDSLSTEPLGKLSLDTANGVIRIYARNSLTLGGLMPSTNGPGKVLFVYSGTAMASVEQALGATIVAPNAKVELKSVASPGHVGSVYAKQVELHQNTAFSQVAFQGSWRP